MTTVKSTILGLAVSIASGMAANSAVIGTFADGTMEGKSAYAWSFSEAGSRHAYSAAIATCEIESGCAATAQSNSYNEYQVRFNPTDDYLAKHASGAGVLVQMSYSLSATGLANASLTWGTNEIEVGPEFGSIQEASGVTQVLFVFDEDGGFYFQVFEMATNADASANGVVGGRQSQSSIAYADPIFSPIDPEEYGGTWEFIEDLGEIQVDQFGERNASIELPIVVPESPPSIPLPATFPLLLVGAATIFALRGSARRS